ncbi:hypothetical protein BDW02DRAFT_565110 [Decorospora gaudefroyi]|uniref:HAUS augmin-like complex subunit 6 N-terminal domain-containing protein n=1 Tax=Decorospora gaudefroyi TaxID=184978 RepID=A0A6A5KS50_9PLEO|nr:hypothetical protein BDW02DRAFT_565110 [Decorospora gaudefroyi]
MRPASGLRLFVTNLRLLDLDLRHDWPNITVHTFSAKHADQRQRISGTEWALFRLFELWDANETAQKLQPFFPPLEPLQSVNLRAALYRWLNDVKKHGVLGRESVLRKTMLDECKGDRFFEILALFSNAVLHKVLAARDGDGNGNGNGNGANRSAAVARELATAPMLSAHQQPSLLPLAIAHKAALVSVLSRKDEKRAKYTTFDRLLAAKTEAITRRIRLSKDTSGAKKPALSPNQADAVKKLLHDNWIGSHKWLPVMLRGNDPPAEDGFLSTRFDKVWYMVDEGRKLQDVATEPGLLETLQSRVRDQQERLQRWTAIHHDLRKHGLQQETPTPPSALAPSNDFNFDQHSKYQLPSSKQQAEDAITRPLTMRPEFVDILAAMDTELRRAIHVGTNSTSTGIPPRRASLAEASHSPSRSRKIAQSESIRGVPPSPAKPAYLKLQLQSSQSSLDRVPILPRPHYLPTSITPTASEPTLIRHTYTLRSAPTYTLTDSPSDDPYGSRPSPEPSPPASDLMVETHSPKPTENTAAPSEHVSPSPHPAVSSKPPVPVSDSPERDTEETLADQIMNSISNATPSPIKKPQPRMSLSLIERTRMSMARTMPFEPVPESPDLPLPCMPAPAPEDSVAGATLLERTRLSMVAMQCRPRKATAPTKEKRKSARSSLFPVNQFDTPRNRKSFELLEHAKMESIERTPTEVLFSDEVNYDRVFKSRPRVATSPLWAGQEEDEDVDGITGIDLGDVDQSDEEGEEGMGCWADSPSKKRGIEARV